VFMSARPYRGRWRGQARPPLPVDSARRPRHPSHFSARGQSRIGTVPEPTLKGPTCRGDRSLHSLHTSVSTGPGDPPQRSAPGSTKKRFVGARAGWQRRRSIADTPATGRSPGRSSSATSHRIEGCLGESTSRSNWRSSTRCSSAFEPPHRELWVQDLQAAPIRSRSFRSASCPKALGTPCSQSFLRPRGRGVGGAQKTGGSRPPRSVVSGGSAARRNRVRGLRRPEPQRSSSSAHEIRRRDKKSIFTVLISSFRCAACSPCTASANVGAGGDVALFFGLSGPGKRRRAASHWRRRARLERRRRLQFRGRLLRKAD
jgi:hypothetical protein